MTSYSSSRRRQSIRKAAVSGAIAVMIAGAAVAAVDSYNAAGAQREAAARALHDYAVFASYTYAQNAYAYARDQAANAYAGLSGFSPGPLEPMPPETIVLSPIESCDSRTRPELYRFRLDLPSRALHISATGEAGMGLWQRLDHIGAVQHVAPLSLGREFESLLADTLNLLATTPAVRQAGWGYAFLRNGANVDAVSFHPVYATSGAVVAVYGYKTCVGHSAFATLYRDVQPLPPTLPSSGQPRDSVLVLRVTDPRGTLLFASAASGQQARATGVTRLPLFAGISFAVGIRPSFAARVIGDAGSPWGTRRALALLILTVALGGAASVLFRREAHFFRTREAFVRDVSHELRTPLQQILIFVQLLRLDRLPTQRDRARSLAIIETETQRLIGLVANVLEKTRPEVRETVSVSTDVQDVIRNSITLFSPLAEARHTTITSTGENAFAMADPESLHQVLTNLLDNAVKYGPAGQTVTVASSVIDEWVIIHIDDEGPGIPVAEREQAWEPFVRLGPVAQRSSGGVGIGLAIVRAAVHRMAGTITIDDSPCGGARLTLRLPRGHSDITPAPVAERAQ